MKDPAVVGRSNVSQLSFKNHGNAVERRTRPARASLLVECPRGRERPRIERNDRVELGTVGVVSLDAGKAKLHEFLRAENAGFERGVDLGDARRGQLESLRRSKCYERQKYEQGC